MKIVKKDEEQLDESVSVSTDILSEMKKQLEDTAKDKFLHYAEKLKHLTKGKWFTLDKHQKLFNSPRSESAQILMTLYALQMLAIRKKEGTLISEYKVDLTKEAQLKVLDDNIRQLEVQLLIFKTERDELMSK